MIEHLQTHWLGLLSLASVLAGYQAAWLVSRIGCGAVKDSGGCAIRDSDPNMCKQGGLNDDSTTQRY